jgi:pimeloyl-ACP methyl ester carboxylesterase
MPAMATPRVTRSIAYRPPMPGKQFELTTAEGRRLEAIRDGAEQGPLVVLHHGTPGSAHEIWPGNVEQAAARGIRLAGYSRPGGGASERHPGRSVADCAADAAAVADALGADRFYTLGGSGGGPHALACAALRPDRVIAAATIAGVAPRDAEGLDWLDGMGEENHDEFAAAQAGPAALEEFIAGWMSQLREVTGEAVLGSLGDLVSEPDAAVLTGDYADFAADGIRHSVSNGYWGWLDDDLAILADWGFALDGIEVPVSIWQGRQDRFVPPAHGEWLAGRVTGAEVHLLDDHGHLSLALGHFGEILDELVAGGA